MRREAQKNPVGVTEVNQKRKKKGEQRGPPGIRGGGSQNGKVGTEGLNSWYTRSEGGSGFR